MMGAMISRHQAGVEYQKERGVWGGEWGDACWYVRGHYDRVRAILMAENRWNGP